MPSRAQQSALYETAFTRLVGIAVRRMGCTEADAQDLTQQALVDALALPSGAPTDLRSLVGVAATLLKGHQLNKLRAIKRRQDPRWLPVAAAQSGGLQRTPEDLASLRELTAHAITWLEQALRGDTLGTRILGAMAEGHDTAADQVELLGEDIEEIRNARKRVSRAMAALARAEAGLAPGSGPPTTIAEDSGYEDETREPAEP